MQVHAVRKLTFLSAQWPWLKRSQAWKAIDRALARRSPPCRRAGWAHNASTFLSRSAPLSTNHRRGHRRGVLRFRQRRTLFSLRQCAVGWLEPVWGPGNTAESSGTRSSSSGGPTLLVTLVLFGVPIGNCFSAGR